VTDVRTGKVRQVECHTLVFTGDWITDHELARMVGVEISRGTSGPAVDTALRTSVPGVFAAGNVIHAAETADVAALGGRHAGCQIAAFLCHRAADDSSSGSARARVPIEVVTPLTWIAPNAIGADRTVPSRNCFILRSEGPRRIASLEVRQDGRLLAASRTRLMPARSITLSARWVADVNTLGGAVRVTARLLREGN
jgi:hypothetical protein